MNTAACDESCVLSCPLPCQYVGNGYFATRHSRLFCVSNELYRDNSYLQDRMTKVCTHTYIYYWLGCNSFCSLLNIEICKSTIDQLRTQGSHSGDLQGRVQSINSRQLHNYGRLLQCGCTLWQNCSAYMCLYSYKYRNFICTYQCKS